MKIILLFLIVFVLVGTSFGGDTKYITPSVKTIYPSYVTDKRANLCALISSNDGSVISRGFAIRESDGTKEPEGRLECRDRVDNYCLVLRIKPGLKYTVRAYICTANGTFYGNLVTFTAKL